jgi:hypothetical protein
VTLALPWLHGSASSYDHQNRNEHRTYRCPHAVK